MESMDLFAIVWRRVIFPLEPDRMNITIFRYMGLEGRVGLLARASVNIRQSHHRLILVLGFLSIIYHRINGIESDTLEGEGVIRRPIASPRGRVVTDPNTGLQSRVRV